MPEEPEQIRAFVCIKLQSALIEELRDLRQRLESALPKERVRWTPPEQIHLTLKFLGNVPENDLTHLQAALEHACGAERPFELRAEGIGAFPTARNPRVIWVGLAGNLERLLTLQKRIDAALQTWSQTDESRPFRPHLTLARVRVPPSRVSRQIGEHLQKIGFASSHPWPVKQIFLMQSLLRPEGAVHSVIASTPFSGSASVEVTDQNPGPNR